MWAGYSRRAPILRGLDWAIGQGRVALLGPNGAGKTTILRVLCGLLSVRDGTVQVRGHLVTPRVPMGSVVGYLPQDFRGVRSFSVLDQVQYCAWLSGVGRASAKTLAGQALRRVNLTDHASRSATALSGGQTRRLGLACAVVHQPPIVLLDEPTAGLDPVERDEVEDLMSSLDAETVLATTHVVDSISGVFDAVAVCRGGEILVSEPLTWYANHFRAKDVNHIDWRQVYRQVVADQRDR